MCKAETSAHAVPAGDSKAKYALGDAVVDGARKRVADLLARYPLYPEIQI